MENSVSSLIPMGIVLPSSVAVISETMESGARIESHKAAILAALRIAGELFEERSQSETLAGDIAALSDEIRPWLPPAKRNS